MTTEAPETCAYCETARPIEGRRFCLPCLRETILPRTYMNIHAAAKRSPQAWPKPKPPDVGR